jgi:hypothetical protein
VRFEAVLELNGRTATGIEVPADVVAALGRGHRPPVTVTIDGYTYRSTVARMGGRYLLPVAAVHREAAGVAAGDALVVEVELDDQPRVVDVPADLASALDADPAARGAWEALAYTHRKEHVRAIEEAKKPETRARRVDKTLAMLRD